MPNSNSNTYKKILHIKRLQTACKKSQEGKLRDRVPLRCDFVFSVLITSLVVTAASCLKIVLLVL